MAVGLAIGTQCALEVLEDRANHRPKFAQCAADEVGFGAPQVPYEAPHPCEISAFMLMILRVRGAQQQVAYPLVRQCPDLLALVAVGIECAFATCPHDVAQSVECLVNMLGIESIVRRCRLAHASSVSAEASRLLSLSSTCQILRSPENRLWIRAGHFAATRSSDFEIHFLVMYACNV
jgi:hypothetical protein